MDQHQVDGINLTAEAGIAIETVIASAQFKNWLASMDRERFTVKSVHIQSVDMFGPKVGFIKLKADVVSQDGKFIPGIVFIRGGSVGILPVFHCEGKNYAVVTVQPRVPTGQFNFVEIPAGMLDGSGNFGGTAAKELKEELELTVSEAELTDLTSLAGCPEGMFLSPGGSDEVMRLFAFCRTVSNDELVAMNGRYTGVLAEGETITLSIVALEDIASIPDAKTLVAYGLFQRFCHRIPGYVKNA